MAVLDDDFSVGATLVEDGAGIWSSPKSTETAPPQDFQTLYEQQRARAEVAEARCEELRWAEVAARSDAGSDSETGAEFTAITYSVLGTLSMNGIDVLCWLEAWLAACAANGRQPPDDLSPWLPWSMSEERRRELTAPE